MEVPTGIGFGLASFGNFQERIFSMSSDQFVFILFLRPHMKIYSNHNVSQPLKEAKMLFGRTLQIMRAILQVRFAVSALDSKGLQFSK